MKKLIIAAILIFTLIILLVVLLSPLFLNRYRPQILSRVSQTINHEICAGDISLTFFSGIGLKISDISVTNNPGFSKEPLLRIEKAEMKIELPALLRGEVRVNKFFIYGPDINIEKNISGAFNFDDMANNAEKKTVKKNITHSAASSEDTFPAYLLVSHIHIIDGKIFYYDAVSQIKININNLDISLADLSADSPVKFRMSCSSPSLAKKIALSGTAGPVGKNPNINNTNLSVNAEITDLNVRRCCSLSGKDIPYDIDQGTISLQMTALGTISDGLKINGTTDILSLTAHDPETKQTVIKNASFRIKHDLLLHIKDEKIVLTKAELSSDILGKDGKLTACAEINTAFTPVSYKAELSSAKIDIATVQGFFTKGEEIISGKLSSDVIIKGTGFETEELEKNLSGSGSFKIEDGTFNKVNSEKEILKGISEKFHIPFKKLARTLKLKNTDSKSTSFEELNAEFVIGSGKININDSKIISDNHGFNLKGNISFDSCLDMKGKMILLAKAGEADKKGRSNHEIDENLLKQFSKKFKTANLTYYLLDEKGQRYIPFNIKGNISKPTVRVDFDLLVKKQVTDRVNRNLKKLGTEGEGILKSLDNLLR